MHLRRGAGCGRQRAGVSAETATRRRCGGGIAFVGIALLLLLPAATAASNPCKDAPFVCEAEDTCPAGCDSDMYHCTGSANTTLQCSHAGLFEAEIGRDVALFLVLPIFLALASAAGVGGGGIVVPILLVLSDFPAYYSVPLSNTCVVGVSLVAFLMQVRSKHPDPAAHGRPLIAFDVALLLMPGALAGTVLGVLLNGVSPNWLVLGVIFLVLTYSSIKTVRKGLQLRQLEKHRAAVERYNRSIAGPSTEVVMQHQSTVYGSTSLHSSRGESSRLSTIADDETESAESGDERDTRRGSVQSNSRKSQQHAGDSGDDASSDRQSEGQSGTENGGQGLGGTNLLLHKDDEDHGLLEANGRPPLPVKMNGGDGHAGVVLAVSNNADAAEDLDELESQAASPVVHIVDLDELCLYPANGLNAPAAQQQQQQQGSDPHQKNGIELRLLPSKLVLDDTPQLIAESSTDEQPSGTTQPSHLNRKLPKEQEQHRPGSPVRLRFFSGSSSVLAQDATQINSDQPSPLALSLSQSHPLSPLPYRPPRTKSFRRGHKSFRHNVIYHYRRESNSTAPEPSDNDPEVVRKVAMQEMIWKEEAEFPWKTLGLIVCFFLGQVGLNLARTLGTECGSSAYWGLTATTFVYLLGCTYVGTMVVRRRRDRRRECDYPEVAGDPDLTGRQLYLYPLLAVFVGVLAGFLGIGGGMVLGPMLLQMGMLPIVSAPTSGFMTLVTSLSAFVQYLTLGRTPWDYGLLLFAIGCLASVVGQMYVLGYARRSGRYSLVVFAIAFIIIASTILTCVTGALAVKEDVDQGRGIGFSPLCE